MSDSQPLAGKRVVVTRAIEQAEGMVRALKAAGAEVLPAPAVTFLEPVDTRALDEALRTLETFDWLIFTSQNAVRFVAQRCAVAGREPGTMAQGKPQVAAVGKATAVVARAAGFRVDFIASRSHGRALAEELGSRLGGKRVLLPRSDRARPELPESLRAAGARVTEVVAYRTAYAELRGKEVLERIRRGQVDVVTFASPSAFHALVQALGMETMRAISASVAFAAVGPVTAESIASAGLPVAVEAVQSSSAGMVAAIVDYYRRTTVASGASSR